MSSAVIGPVVGIALRSPNKGPMREVPSVLATVRSGLIGNTHTSPNRAITLISAEHWRQTTTEIDAILPWHTRRANILVECGGLGNLIGKRIRVGAVEVEVINETQPCERMDELHAGLRAALSPSCRGGIYGRILNDGEIRIGDQVALVAT